VLLAVGWLAAVWPARRASCIRPAVVLRDVE
jgi:ABC-type lipoprotein release transport system permease subunit